MQRKKTGREGDDSLRHSKAEEMSPVPINQIH